MRNTTPCEVVIIGAGVSGLSCARALHRNHISFTILERSARPGGRIKTDQIDGFQLDHGFQVLQTGYPGIGDYLRLDDLRLSPFPAGVRIRYAGGFHVLADPRLHLKHAASTIVSPIGTFRDRIRVLTLAREVSARSMQEIFSEPEETASEFLRSRGFSADFISRFFTPFLAGACLDQSLQVSCRVLKYVMRLFTTGAATLPAEGMEAIVSQLVSGLPEGSIQYEREVTRVEPGSVTLAGGEIIEADKIVLAIAERELGTLLAAAGPRPSVGEACLYFSADWRPPFREPFLMLNGDNRGPVNNIAFPSQVSRGYAPPGKTLIAIVVLGDQFIGRDDLEDLVRLQCTEWFGSAVSQWQHLKTYRIHHALPLQNPPTASPYQAVQPRQSGIVVCGEHHSLPGLQWAMMSGATAAETIIRPSSGD